MLARLLLEERGLLPAAELGVEFRLVLLAFALAAFAFLLIPVGRWNHERLRRRHSRLRLRVRHFAFPASERRVSGEDARSSSVTGAPSSSNGGTSESSNRCWTMWTQRKTSAYTSIGDMSASAINASPVANQAIRDRGHGDRGYRRFTARTPIA